LSEARVALWPQVCQADELVLFERATFLVISNVVRRPHADVHRFEKVSNIIKQFKLSCSKSAAHFATMQVRNSHYSALIEGFTSTTYAMVITSDPTTQPATILINIEASRAYFESLIATMSAAANFGGIDRGVNDRNPEGSEGVGGLSLSGPHG
jgi:Ras-related GTP-binding protein A/B